MNCRSEFIVSINIDTNLAKKRIENDHVNNLRRFEDVQLSSLSIHYKTMVKNQNELKNMLKEKFFIEINGEWDMEKNTSYLKKAVLNILGT